MGVAAYNRGTRLLSRQIECNPGVADRDGRENEINRLREYTASLERDLARARWCLAAERLGREALRLRFAQATRNYTFAVSTLSRIAFSEDVLGQGDMREAVAWVECAALPVGQQP